MSQNPLFPATPISRRTDPGTSKKAEYEYTLGPRAKRCRQVLELVRDHPFSTTGELARHMAATYPELPIATAVETPHKRMADLEAKGLVYRHNPRKCRDSGKDRFTWMISTKGIVELRRQ